MFVKFQILEVAWAKCVCHTCRIDIPGWWSSSSESGFVLFLRWLVMLLIRLSLNFDLSLALILKWPISDF